MNKRTYGGMNVGTSSVLVAFVLVCLITFAGLSFLSANSDYTLSKQSADRTKNYYSANMSAEYELADIDEVLTKAAREASDKSSFYALAEEKLSDNRDITIISSEEDELIFFYVKDIDDKQQLYVELAVNYPQPSNYCTYKIIHWNTQMNPEWSDDSEDKGVKLLFM